LDVLFRPVVLGGGLIRSDYSDTPTEPSLRPAATGTGSGQGTSRSGGDNSDGDRSDGSGPGRLIGHLTGIPAYLQKLVIPFGEGSHELNTAARDTIGAWAELYTSWADAVVGLGGDVRIVVHAHASKHRSTAEDRANAVAS